eukprot:757086-Amphidinium_carterae.1
MEKDPVGHDFVRKGSLYFEYFQARCAQLKASASSSSSSGQPTPAHEADLTALPKSMESAVTVDLTSTQTNATIVQASTSGSSCMPRPPIARGSAACAVAAPIAKAMQAP